MMGIRKNNTDTKVPISQGQGVTSSEAKVVGVHHMVGVEAFDISHVQRIVREMWSFTTDLGTDVKVTDFSIDPTKRSTLMPSWMSADVAALPLVEEFPEDFPEQGPAAEPPAGVGYHNPFVQCEGQEALVNAIPISGVGHSIHNIAKLLPDAMRQFKWFKKRLKTLEMVLRHPGRSERIVATCIVGTPYGKHSNIILSFGYTLHEARWQSLILFCQATVLPLAVLRRAWSQEQYEGNGVGKLVERGWSQEDGSDGQKFNPQELTDLLKSVFFFRYYHRMMIVLGQVPKKLQRWADGCPCHEQLLIGKTRHLQQAALLRDGLPHKHCPATSCRLPEIVDGKLDTVIEDLGAQARTELQAAIDTTASDSVTDDVTPEDIILIFEDLNSAVSQMQVGYSIRLGWTTNLPWMIAGMCVPIPARSLRWAKACVKAFDSKPVKMHHRRSVAFLLPGSEVRGMIDAFISSGTMCEGLKFQIAPFNFVPLGDRLIEMEHKPISDLVRPKLRITKGHNFSVRRLKKIEELMFPTSPSSAAAQVREDFVGHFMKTKTIKNVLTLMGMDKHPFFQDVMKRRVADIEKHRANLAWNHFEEIFDRHSVDLKYQRHLKEKKHNERQERWLKGNKDKPPAIQSPVSVEQLLMQNAADHLRSVGNMYKLISMPLGPESGIELVAHSIAEALHDVDAEVLPQIKRARLEEPDAVVAEQSGEEEVAGVGQTMCFKVVRAEVGRMKTIATYTHRGGETLAQNEMAISLHNVMGGPQGEIITDLRPRCIGLKHNMRVMLVKDLRATCSLPMLEASVQGWHDARPTAFFSLPQLSRVDKMVVHNALDECFRTKAVYDKDGVVTADSTQEPWKSLLEHGFVEVRQKPSDDQSLLAVVSQSGLVLSSKAMGSIIVGSWYKEFHPVFKVRAALPQPELTGFELGRLLMSHGWEWKPMPRAINDRLQLKHHTDGPPMVWFTLGRTLLRPFLLCLLNSEELRQMYGV